jgi:hypothetical protein
MHTRQAVIYVPQDTTIQSPEALVLHVLLGLSQMQRKLHVMCALMATLAHRQGAFVRRVRWAKNPVSPRRLASLVAWDTSIPRREALAWSAQQDRNQITQKLPVLHAQRDTISRSLEGRARHAPLAHSAMPLAQDALRAPMAIILDRQGLAQRAQQDRNLR